MAGCHSGSATPSLKRQAIDKEVGEMAATKKGSAAKKAPVKAKAEKKESAGRTYKSLDEMSDRMRAYQARFADENKVIGARIIQEHKKGFFLVQMADGEWRVGRLSSTGKSFNVEFKSAERAEALAYYQENRPAKAEKADKPATKKTASKKGKGSATSAKSRKAKPKSKPEPEPDFDDLDDDLDDLMD